MPKPKTERLGLDDVMREATRAAEAWNRNHVAQQMRKSGKQLESERPSRRPESRSKGVDR